MHLRTAFENAAHLPTCIVTDKVTQQGASCTKAITAKEWSDAGSFDCYRYRAVRIACIRVRNFRATDFIVTTVPCSS